ncbi:hypothetical protein [Alienimonas chondri]|uniref:Zinc finger/thioredoxin putative domain-containing protein n=1 Tax=Alienimonas chondri TaxID=2681879 RepID=A0ABX1V9P3_9PLAN|nr:hypothetical protein [Alienimonas chondri]NNJ24805.1 hypothetical protein [Alienimonas chondri]
MSAAIVTRCPDCAKAIKLKPSFAGRKVKCPGCGGPVQVPAEADAADPRPAKASPAKTKAKRKRPTSPADEPGGSGNSGELFAGLDLGKYGHESGSQKALPARVNKGPLTDEHPIPAERGPKKEEKPPTPMPVVLGIIGGSLLVLMLAAGGALWALAGAQPAEPPGPLVRFEHPEPRQFSIDVPDNWETTKVGGGVGGRPSFATFEGPGGEVQVRRSPSGSLFGDIAGAGDTQLAPGEEMPEELTPIFTQHDATKSQVESNFSNYSETGGENFDPRAGKDNGRRSVFTASGTLGGQITGLRGTVRVGNETFTVVMQCSPRDFPTLRPVYEKMLDSMGN